mgnify:CR=1 FL=1
MLFRSNVGPGTNGADIDPFRKGKGKGKGGGGYGKGGYQQPKGGGKAGGFAGGGKGGGKGGKGGDVDCYNCGQKGHISAKCPNKDKVNVLFVQAKSQLDLPWTKVKVKTLIV